MSEMYQRIVSQRNSLEKLFARIPGFRGYAEMNARRDADRMIRDHMVTLLREQMTHLISVEKKMMAGGSLALVGQTRGPKTVFQTYIDRVATSSPGYSGFFAANKIKPEDLEKVYAFDAALVDFVDRFRETINKLEEAVTAKQGTDEAIAALDALAHEANAAYNMRDSVLNEIY